MPDIKIDVRGVEKLLTDLDPAKACGPDGLTPRFLKELAPILAPTLTMIFSKSLDTSKIPARWKLA